jgi:hypothetical protein
MENNPITTGKAPKKPVQLGPPITMKGRDNTVLKTTPAIDRMIESMTNATSLLIQ